LLTTLCREKCRKKREQMSNKDVEKCHTVIMIHGQCKNEWCYASGICALCKKCEDCCKCAYLPCDSCDCDACKKISKDTSKTDGQDIWNRISDELYERRTAMTEMSEQIAKLRKERDEARRMCCEHLHLFNNPHNQKESYKQTAIQLGWDCYEKEENK
jgi:hypothetical protein